MSSKKYKILLFLFVILTACTTQFASDIYAPSLPSVAKEFATTINLSQWSMAIFMLGVAITTLIYGPLSEGLGRKGPLLFGLFVMLIGSIICMLSNSIDTLIFGRFIQGTGAGACSCLWRPIFRDLFKGDELAKYSSYITVFIVFITPAAPALGGYFQKFYSFRASFVFMTLFVAVALAGILFGFKDTSQYHCKSKLKLPYIGKTFRIILTSRVFMGFSFCVFLTYGTLFAWLTVSPVLMIKKAGATPVEFGWITFLSSCSMFALSGFLNGKLVTKLGAKPLLRLGWATVIGSGAFLLIASLFLGNLLWPLIVGSVLLYFGSTFIWPNAFAGAFTPFGEIAGYAGSAYSFMQISGAAALGGLISFLPDENSIPIAIVMMGAPFLAWMIYETLIPKDPPKKSA